MPIDPPAPAWALLACLPCIGCTVARGGLNADGGTDAVDAAGPDSSRTDAACRMCSTDAGRDAHAEGGTDAGPEAGMDTGLADGGLPFCDPANPLLVACYRFDDSLADGSMYGNHITGSDHDFSTGRVGRAVQTSPSTSLVAPYDDSLDVSALTLEVWVHPEEVPSSGRVGLIDKDGSYGMFVHPGGEVRCITSNTATAAGAVATGNWSHIACTDDGTVLRIYVDGAEAASVSSGANSASSAGLYVGENGTAGDDQLIGRLDELRIWSEARTPEQIAAAASR